MTTQANKVPDWMLERLAAGELPASRAAELRATLAAQGEEHRLAEIAESNAQILAELPAEQVAAEVQRRATARQAPARRPRPVFAWSLATAGVAGLALFLATRTGVEPKRPECKGEICFKGPPSLRIHRQTKSGVELLDRESILHEGDSLQIGYIASGKRFGVVASVDARGAITLHLPEKSGPAVALESGGLHRLPHSYELDDSPGFERFVLVTSDSSFTTAEVESALKSGGGWPPRSTVYELTLRKAAP